MKGKLFNVLVGCNIVLYLTSLALWISIDDEVFLNSVVSLITCSLTLILVIIKRNRFSAYYKSAQFQKLSSSLLTCFLVFYILGLINYLFFKNPLQVDLSQKKFNSLRQQTVKVLDSLEGKIEVDVFAKKSDHANISALFKLYSVHKSDISVRYIDIDTRPDLVAESKITQVPTIIVTKGDRTARFTRVRELELTNALYRVGSAKESILCVDSSHSKFSWYSDDNIHHSALKRLLDKEGYRIEDYKLVSSDPLGICDALVLWGVEVDLEQREIEAIKKYRKSGGALLVAINPQFNGDSIPNFRKYLKEVGIKVHNLLAISPKSNVQGSKGTVPIAEDFDLRHPIFEGFTGYAFFPLATVLEFDKTKIDKGRTLIRSTPLSWGESNFLELDKKKFDKSKDIPGPLNFALAHEFDDSSRIVVFSNSSFVSNNFTKYGVHFSIVVNSISWLTRNNQLISFDRTTIKDEPIFISAPQLGIIFFFSVIIIPVILIILSIIIYRRRGRL
ncbi:Gldg family protein [Halobacteriovorax sp. HLS]|uniref:Gldg family protein n=1 Tax=Halobacteriovorax sp. HLS TaxID=2234000 RepID=UPI0013E3E429|nr:Gldg family protein [Halobacteriovorax sp. HLS]